MERQVYAPSIGELPTTSQLNRATLIAAVVAGALLATVVLPAEYGIDPTGTGRVLGLTAMGEGKRAEARASGSPAAAPPAPSATAAPAPAAAASAVASATDDGVGTGQAQLTLRPGEGGEVKATMRTGDSFTYDWATGGARVNYELHGEPPGAASDEYTTYRKGTSAGETGSFTATFDGTHGWYWRNRTATPLTVTVRANGTFSKFARMK